MKTIKIKINKLLKSYKIGDIIAIQVDNKGIPLDRYWRMRFRDSKIDDCVSVYKEPAQEKVAQNYKKSDNNIKNNNRNKS